MDRSTKRIDDLAHVSQTQGGEPAMSVSPGASAGHELPRSIAGVAVDYTHTKSAAVDPALLRERRILLGRGQEPLEHAYKVVRTQVLHRMRVKGLRTLAITSPTDGNGKTLTTINLGISLAREVNQTVLLVDLDLRRPSLGRYFVDDTHPGLSDYLIGSAALSDILIHPKIDRMVVLPGREPFAHSSEVLSSPRMAELVKELKTRYEDRLTLFDMPPLLASDDVIAFLPSIDAVLLVVEAGQTTADQIKKAQEFLGEEKLLGIVLNKARETEPTIGYY